MASDEEIEEIIKAIRELPIDNISRYPQNPKKVEEGLKTGRYLIDANQAKKVTKIIDFFKHLKNDNCEHDIEVSQRPYSGDIQITFYVLDMGEKDLKKFIKLLEDVYALNISMSKDERIMLELTVPGVFVLSDVRNK